MYHFLNLTCRYLSSPTAPLSASNIRPEMKIVVVVRDPVERLVIHLNHQLYSIRRSKIPSDQRKLVPPSDWPSMHPLLFKDEEALPETLITNIAVNSSIYHK